MVWQAGQSGNPGGRPKRDKFITQRLIAELKEIDPVTQAPRLHKVAKALVEKAEGGDVVAAREIMDRVEGKVPQAIGGDPENPLDTVTRIETHIIKPRHDKDGTVIPYQPGESMVAEEIHVWERVVVPVEVPLDENPRLGDA